MNMKRIEFVSNAYKQTADEATRARIALFEPVWAAQAEGAEVAERALEASGWHAPATDDLERWYWEGTPFFTQAPAPVDGNLLAQSAASIAGALVCSGALDQDCAQSLGACDWKGLVARTPLDEAGRDPGRYLDSCAEAAAQACGENAAGSALLVLALALRPQLEPAAQRTMTAVQAGIGANPAQQLKPRVCPVCGSEAGLAHISPTETNKANVRTLYCSQCGSGWEFERIRCARCGTQDQEKLHYKSIEGDEAHRLHTCDSCGGYIRSCFALKGDLKPFAAEVEDVVMAELDAVAADLGLGGAQ